MSYLTASRVRTNPPATSQVTCIVFNRGVQHLIAERPSIAEVLMKVAEIYGSGKRFAPIVKFRNGEVRRIVVNSITSVSSNSIEFEGMIANGSDFVRAAVRFTGATGNAGSMALVD